MQVWQFLAIGLAMEIATPNVALAQIRCGGPNWHLQNNECVSNDGQWHLRLSFAIAEIKPEPGAPETTNTNGTIEAADKPGEFQFNGTYGLFLPDILKNNSAVYRGKVTLSLWFPGAIHTVKGTIMLKGYTLTSEPGNPLVFKVEREGYTYIRGRGTVITPAGMHILLQEKS